MPMNWGEGETPQWGGGIFRQEKPFRRGNRQLQNPLFFVADTEERQADAGLKAIGRDFQAAYSGTGRPSIPPSARLQAPAGRLAVGRRLPPAAPGQAAAENCRGLAPKDRSKAEIRGPPRSGGQLARSRKCD